MIKEAILKVYKHEDLTYEEAYETMDEIMSGKASEVQMSAYLTAMSMKGETIEDYAPLYRMPDFDYVHTQSMGDVDGNGWYDANDAFLVRMISNGLIDKSVLSSAAQRAADCNHDGEINELDFEILNNASVLLDNIDQSATQTELETNSVYIEYMSLIDQSAGVETEDTTPEANEVVGEFDIEAIFAKIFEFIRKIFAFVLENSKKVGE